MKTKGSTQFNCFSPPIMVATMITELFLAAYTLWRFKMSPMVRLATVTLTMLATFQLAEYFVCTGAAASSLPWSRIGFAAITVLPAIGVHLMYVVAGKKDRTIVATSYATMGAFIGFFLAYPNVFNSHQCTGNYVVFHLSPVAGGVYWVYYMGWIFVASVLGLHWANQANNRGDTSHVNAIQGLIVGWLLFLVPTAIANMVSPASRNGIPSVMCGFAVLFALVLALYVLPITAKVKRVINPIFRIPT